MDLHEILTRRLGMADVARLSRACTGTGGNPLKQELFDAIGNDNDRVANNALWVFTHFKPDDKAWLLPHRNELIDMLLQTSSTTRIRLILTLLDAMPTTPNDVRPDYLDFCLAAINSPLPGGVRSLCIKQGFAQCRHYPELMQEFLAELELIDCGTASPGILSARRNVLKQLACPR